MFSFKLDLDDPVHMREEPSVGMYTHEDLSALQAQINEGASDFDPADFESVGNVLGRGASGSVRRMRLLSANQLYAVKSIRLGSATGRIEVCRELLTHLLPDKEGKQWLVKYHGVYYDEGTVNIVMDLMGGSLSMLPAPTPEPIAAKITKMLLLGLQYLHEEAQLMHRDIKPSNVLFGVDGKFRLTDFGLSSKTSNADGGERTSETFVGTVLYMSPERLRGASGGHSAKTDIFSLGFSVAEFITGTHPLRPLMGPAFSGSSEERFWGVMRILVPLDDTAPPIIRTYIESLPGVSEALKDFLLKALEIDDHKRASARELLEHPWLREHCTASTPLGGGEDCDVEAVRNYLISKGLIEEAQGHAAAATA